MPSLCLVMVTGQYSGDAGQSVIDAWNPPIVVEKSIVVADDGADVVVTSLLMIVVTVSGHQLIVLEVVLKKNSCSLIWNTFLLTILLPLLPISALALN